VPRMKPIIRPRRTKCEGPGSNSPLFARDHRQGMESTVGTDETVGRRLVGTFPQSLESVGLSLQNAQRSRSDYASLWVANRRWYPFVGQLRRQKSPFASTLIGLQE